MFFITKINFLFYSIAFLLLHNSNGSYQDHLDVIDSIKQEKACVLQGGMCVIEQDCPQPTAVKGLCPEQRSQGVECCYGLSVKETRCRMRGGECFPSNMCNPVVQIKEAKDCNSDQVCCALVK